MPSSDLSSERILTARQTLETNKKVLSQKKSVTSVWLISISNQSVIEVAGGASQSDQFRFGEIRGTGAAHIYWQLAIYYIMMNER